MKKSHKLFIPVVAVMLLGACSMGDMTGTKGKGAIASAIITLGNGQDITFNATANTELPLFQRTLSVALSNPENGTVITLLMLAEDPIDGPGTYNGSITLNRPIDGDRTKAQYRSHYYNHKETAGEVDCVLAITAISEKRVQGTFSGTLYAESGKTAIISGGEFDITIDQDL